jgi:hypothetical protein
MDLPYHCLLCSSDGDATYKKSPGINHGYCVGQGSHCGPGSYFNNSLSPTKGCVTC